MSTPEQDAPGAGPDDGVPFDPTGLDLARQVAASISHAAPVVAPPTPKPRKKAKPGRTASGNRDPLAVGDVLGDVIAARGWTTQVSVHALLGRWAELVGDAVAEHTTPESFDQGVVVVRCASSAWASQLRLLTPQLLARLNDSLGQGTITRLRILGPEAPSWKKGPRSVRDGRGPRDTYG